MLRKDVVRQNRSPQRLIHAEYDFKTWREDVPSVERVRPPCCPSCGGASREPGRSLGLHGHGLRQRQLRGPVERWGRPRILVIAVRRYRCQRCAAVITVAPRGVEPGRLFSLPAIALALWLYGARRASPAVVRRAVSPWQVGATAASGWAQLRRWVRDVGAGRLLGGLPAAAGAGPRAIATRVTMALRGRASSGEGQPREEGHQVWLAALHLGVSIIAR